MLHSVRKTACMKTKQLETKVFHWVWSHITDPRDTTCVDWSLV